MLVDKGNNPAVGEVVTLKLVSGEEIVGRISERTADAIYLSKPVQISLQQVSATEVALAFAPVLGSAQQASTLHIAYTSMAIRPVKTGDDVTRNYLQATSGLVKPTAQQSSAILSS